MAYGILEYNNEGKVKCEICGKYFDFLLKHVYMKHRLKGLTYKRRFGFTLSKGITSKKYEEKRRAMVKADPEKFRKFRAKCNTFSSENQPSHYTKSPEWNIKHSMGMKGINPFKKNKSEEFIQYLKKQELKNNG